MESILNDIEKDIRTSSSWSIVVAILAIICGALAIAAPVWGAVVATMTFGIVSIVAGVFELGFAWRTRKMTGAFWRFISAFAYLAAGIWVIAQPSVGIPALALALGVMLLARGISLLFFTYDMRRTHVWGWFLLDAACSLVLSYFVIKGWPTQSILYLGLFFGAGLVVNGWQRFMVALWVKQVLPPKTKAPPPVSAAHA
jgi:uncharacterized membrane protein HdeD (DUF308 family)